ncbi:unnamed protein product, partial [Gulo gulo]
GWRGPRRPVPGLRQHDLLAGAGGRGRLALLHRHQYSGYEDTDPKVVKKTKEMIHTKRPPCLTSTDSGICRGDGSVELYSLQC